MKKISLLLLFFTIILFGYCRCEESHRGVVIEKSPRIEEGLIPRQIEWEGEVYFYSSSINSYVEHADFDGDGKEEVAVSFATYTGGDVGIPAAFCLIYDGIEGARSLVKTIKGNDYAGMLSAIDLDRDGQEELIMYSHSGAHYTSIVIYDYEQEKYKPIFEDGSACGIEAIYGETSYVKVGRANWEKEGWSYASDPLWEVHLWDGEKFNYSPELSSSNRFSEEEELQRYLNKAEQLIKGD